MTTNPIYESLVIPVNNGPDGNAFAVLGKLSQGLRKLGVASEEIEKITAEAMKGDYTHLLQTVGKYATVEHT